MIAHLVKKKKRKSRKPLHLSLFEKERKKLRKMQYFVKKI